MQTAATLGAVRSVGSGRRAFAARLRTLPGVSAPSSVVRSTIEMAVSIAHALAVVLIERVPSWAARASAPTWSTPGRPCRKARNAESDRVTSSYGGSGPVMGRAYADGASGSSTWVMPIILPCPSTRSRCRSPVGVKAPAGSVDRLLNWGFQVVERLHLRYPSYVCSDDELFAMSGPAL